MLSPVSNEFTLHIKSSALSGSSSLGQSVTPGNNTYGTYVQMLSGATVTDNAYEIWINVNGMSVSGAARDALVTIGFDPAGGTSYTDTIVDLSGSCAGPVGGTGGGIWYRFPLFVKAGTSIAAKASVNNATVGTCFVYCKLMCRPTRPDLVRAGSFVRTFGSTPASSSGTAIAPVSGSKSAYVQVGAATAETLWFWTIGAGVNNASMSNSPSVLDLALGTAGSKRDVISDLSFITNTSEALQFVSWGVTAGSPAGDLVFVRAQSSGAPVTGWSAIAYAVGG